MGSGQKVVNWRRRNKRRSIVYKGGQCIACGYQRCHSALAFHHLDPIGKDFRVGSGSTFAWRRIKQELDKCVLLCHNCHAETHAGVLDLSIHLHKSPTPDEGDALLARAGLAVRPAARKRTRVCPQCGASKHPRSKHCRRCASRDRNTTKIQWPPSAVLQQMVSERPFTQVARDLGVSDNAIRKRLRNHPPE